MDLKDYPELSKWFELGLKHKFPSIVGHTGIGKTEIVRAGPITVTMRLEDWYRWAIPSRMKRIRCKVAGWLHKLALLLDPNIDPREDD